MSASKVKTSPAEIIRQSILRDGGLVSDEMAAAIMRRLTEAGFKILPRSPTQAMLDVDTRDWGSCDTYMEKNALVWDAMWEAAS
jgi:hypothetical protein